MIHKIVREFRAKPLYWSSVLALGLFMLVFLISWLAVHKPFLTDPLIQTDDARWQWTPFYPGMEETLAQDSSINEALLRLPPALRLLYWSLTRIVPFFLAAKILQALHLAIVFYAAWILLRGRKGGLAAAALLIFLALRSAPVVSQIAGGVARGFALPLLYLWGAGALTQNPRPRWIACGLSALFYPIPMLLMLGAEFFLTWPVQWKPLLKLTALCAALTLPSWIQSRQAGAVQSYEEALKEPAMGPQGRNLESESEAVPFGNPAVEFVRYASQLFFPWGKSPLPAAVRLYQTAGIASLMLIFALPLCLILARAAPMPGVTLALTLSAVCLYVLARTMAFHLYMPQRYLSFGIQAASLFLMVETIGRARSETLRHFAAFGFALVLILAAGNGFHPKAALRVDYRSYRPLYEFVRGLPPGSLILTHPEDGDDIPFWTGRATTGGLEIMFPEHKEIWNRRELETKAALAALYSARKKPLLEYCARRRVTHILIRQERYGPEFKKESALFEPFNAFLKDRLQFLKEKNLVLDSAPKEAVIFKGGPFHLLETAKLQKAWGKK